MHECNQTITQVKEKGCSNQETQGLAAATAWLAIAFSGGQAGNLTTFTAAALSAALLAALLAFLFFNWSPAKVFMGDGASGFLGFSFAALPLLVAEPTPADLWLKLNLGALILFPLSLRREFHPDPPRLHYS